MYHCLKRNTLCDLEGYQLVAIRQEDIESIRQWRNAQMEVLRQKVTISSQAQQTYYQQTIWPTFVQSQPKQILFSLLLHDTCIGYGGLTYLDWENQRAEVSFLVDPKRAENDSIYAQDFSHFLRLLCQIAFQDLNLHRLLTETFAFREQTIKILEECGFKGEGRLREHVYKRQQWIDSVMHGLLARDWSYAQ